MTANGNGNGKKTGRPPTHDREKVGLAVCVAIANGDLVKDACKVHGVNPATVWKWAAEDAEFGKVYARAREDQAHAIAEQAIALADAAVPGKGGDVDKVRLQVDTRKWLASKIAPRHYGERQEIAATVTQTTYVVEVPAKHTSPVTWQRQYSRN